MNKIYHEIIILYPLSIDHKSYVNIKRINYK